MDQKRLDKFAKEIERCKEQGLYHPRLEDLARIRGADDLTPDEIEKFRQRAQLLGLK